MGVPIRLVAAVSNNDIIHRTLKDGDLSLDDEVHVTWASAIDIQVPYNIERILLLASDYNLELVKELMIEFETKKKVTLPDSLVMAIRQVITGMRSKELQVYLLKCHLHYQTVSRWTMMRFSRLSKSSLTSLVTLCVRTLPWRLLTMVRP